MRKNLAVHFGVLVALGAGSIYAQSTAQQCAELPTQAELKTALIAAQKQKNGGLGFNMWGTLVNRDGIVCAIAFTGTDRGDQWPGSRAISAQKANTANAF